MKAWIPRGWKALFQLLMLAVGGLLAPALFAQDVPELEQVVDIDLPQAALGNSLNELSRQSGIEFLLTEEPATDTLAPAVSGSMSVSEALRRLLAGTNLAFRQVSHGSIAIEAKKVPSKTGLDELFGFDDAETNRSAPAAQAESPPAQPPQALESIELPEREPGQSADAGERQKPNRFIEEIIVTATKREESLRDIPASMTAIGGADLERTASKGVEDFLDMMPGVTLNDQGTSDMHAITIRGAGFDTGPGNGTLPVGTFIGDVPMGDPFATQVVPNLVPFDLKGVQVLKGPQGTLFGGSALTGLLRYEVMEPQFESMELRGSAGIDSLTDGGQGYTVSIGGNLPLGDRLALRAVQTSRSLAGVIDETGRGEKDVDTGRKNSGRILASILATDELSVDLMWLTQDTHEDDAGFAKGTSGSRTRDNTPEPSYSDSSFDLGTVTLDYALDWANLKSISAATKKHLVTDFSATRTGTGEAPPGPGDPLRAFGEFDTDGLMQELRLVSDGAGPVTWLAGAFWQRYKILGSLEIYGDAGADAVLDDALLLLPGVPNSEEIPAPVEAYIDSQVAEFALFGDATWHVSDALSINLGLRAFDVALEGTTDARYVAVPRPTSTSQRDKGINPKLAVTWQVNEALQFYTMAAKGFRYGGIQVGAPLPVIDMNVNSSYRSDSLWNYELGVRKDWLSNSMQTDLTVFYIDWTDAQYTQTAPSETMFFIDNIGSAKIKGAEFVLQYLPPIDGLSLGLAGAYVDARTAESFMDVDGNEIPPGTQMPGSSPYSTALSINYTRALAAWSFDSFLTHSFQSSGYNNLAHDKEILGYQLWSAGVGFTNESMAYSPGIRFSVSNIANTAGLQNVSGATGTEDAFYTAPRTYTLQLTAEF